MDMKKYRVTFDFYFPSILTEPEIERLLQKKFVIPGCIEYVELEVRRDK